MNMRTETSRPDFLTTPKRNTNTLVPRCRAYRVQSQHTQEYQWYEVVVDGSFDINLIKRACREQQTVTVGSSPLHNCNKFMGNKTPNLNIDLFFFERISTDGAVFKTTTIKYFRLCHNGKHIYTMQVCTLLLVM